MFRSRLKNFHRALPVALLFAGVSLSTTAFGGFKPNTTLEPKEDLTDTSEVVAPTPGPVAPSAEPASYSGQIRRYPDSGSPKVVYGTLSLAITTLGKVTGSITWYDPDEKMIVTGKQDLNTRQGSLVIRDANGNRVPGTPRLPFRISGKGKLVGGGITDNGETASFKLFKQSDASSGDEDTEGGATLSLGASNSYNGSAVINTGTLASVPGTFGSTITINSGTALTGTTGAIVTGGSATPTIVNGNLTYGSSVLLYGPLTTATQADGNVVYTGTNSTGSAATVTVLATGVAVIGG